MTMNYPIIEEIEMLLTKKSISVQEASVILCKGMDVLTVEGTIEGGILNLITTCKIELLYGLNEEILTTSRVFVYGGSFKYLAEIPKNVSPAQPCKIRVSVNKKIQQIVTAKVY